MRRNPNSSMDVCMRSAVTLLEVLIALALIGVLVALLLPAVQSARASARAIECRDNLRQLAIAANTYHEQFGILIPNTYPVRTLIELVSPTFKPRVPQSVASDLSECPADFMSGQGLGQMNYYPSEGLGLYGRGVFGLGQTSFEQVTDGLTTTAFLSEKLAGLDEPGQLASSDRKRSYPRRVDWSLFNTPPSRLDFDQHCVTEQIDFQRPVYRKETYGYALPTDDYDHVVTPNRFTCARTAIGDATHFSENGTSPASSDHRGVVHLLYCDGHVQSISDAIDLHVWRSIGTINGGETNAAGYR